MPRLQAPLSGWRITVNRHSYTTDTLGQIAVTRQADIDALRKLGWALVQPPVPTPVPVPVPTPTPTPFPTVRFDSSFIHADSTTARMSTA